MGLIVLGAFAVYGGTAAAALFLARRYVLPIRTSFAVLLAAAPLLLTGKAMLTGGVYAPLDIAFQSPPLSAHREEAGVGITRNGLIVDVVSQMLPWRQAVREALRHGRLPLWNPFILAGEPLLGVQQPAVFHPATWVGLALPAPQAWTLDVSLRFFLAALSAFLFFRGIGAGDLAALFGAAAWAFSDFLVFFVGYPVAPSVAPFPLLLLGLHRLIEGGDSRAVGLTAAALVLIAVAGHPETLLFAVTGGGIYFSVELARVAPGFRLRAVRLSLLSGSIALGLSAVVLLPFAEIVGQTWQHEMRATFYATAVRSEPLGESLRRLLHSAMPYAYGSLGRSRIALRFGVPAAYAGSILFPLAITGLLSRARARWPLAALAVFGLAVSIRLAGLADALARLPLFDIAVNDYLVFLAILGIAGLAVLGIERLRSGDGMRVFVASSLAAVLVLVLIAASRRPVLRALDMSPADARERVLLQVVPLLLGLLAVLATRGARGGRLAPALLLAILVVERGFEERGSYPTWPARAFYPRLPLLNRIPRGEPWRVAGVGYALAPNASAVYGLEDVRGYDPMVFGPLADTFPLWCVALPTYFNRVDDPTTPFLSFLNVRYVVDPPGAAAPLGWRLVSEDAGTRVLENPNALPRVFVPRHVVWLAGETLEMRVLRRIGDFVNDGVVGRWRPGRLGWLSNGPAEVAIVSYASDRIGLTVDAKGETIVGTSIPAWRGWKLWLDGRRAPLLPFNHAFLAFSVGEGRHEAALRYLPDGFLYGAGITAATAMACAAAILRRRRRARP